MGLAAGSLEWGCRRFGGFPVRNGGAVDLGEGEEEGLRLERERVATEVGELEAGLGGRAREERSWRRRYVGMRDG